MANSYKNNPIILDTVSATVDIALQATELTSAPVHIQKAILSTTATADIVILKDRRGNVKIELEAFAAGQTSEYFDPPLISDGLQIVAGDNTLTSGKVLIYV